MCDKILICHAYFQNLHRLQHSPVQWQASKKQIPWIIKRLFLILTRMMGQITHHLATDTTNCMVPTDCWYGAGYRSSLNYISCRILSVLTTKSRAHFYARERRVRNRCKCSRFLQYTCGHGLEYTPHTSSLLRSTRTISASHWFSAQDYPPHLCPVYFMCFVRDSDVAFRHCYLSEERASCIVSPLLMTQDYSTLPARHHWLWCDGCTLT